MDHFNAVLFLLYFQADLESCIRPDLLIYHTARLLGCQYHMHAQGAANTCHTDQITHKIRSFFL